MSTSTLIQQAYEKLVTCILRGQFVPGQMLNRRNVAADLDMGIAAVREAMIQLEAEGFLETLPRRGTRVRLVSAKDARDQLILRVALECQGARLYCGDPIRRNWQALNELARAADDVEPNTFEENRAEIIFHSALMKLANCPPLLTIFDQVMRHSLFFGIHMVIPMGGRQFSPTGHQNLLEQLKTEQPDQAEAAIRAMLTENREELLDRSASLPSQQPVSDGISHRPIWPSEFDIEASRSVVE